MVRPGGTRLRVDAHVGQVDQIDAILKVFDNDRNAGCADVERIRSGAAFSCVIARFSVCTDLGAASTLCGVGGHCHRAIRRNRKPVLSAASSIQAGSGSGTLLI